MRWYKKAQVVHPYEPAPADTPVEVVNQPVRQVTMAEMDWIYGGRDRDGEKTYDPELIVTYKDGVRFNQKVFYGGRMEELIKKYHDWCKDESLVPVPPRDSEENMRMRTEWYDADEEQAETEEDRRFEEEIETTEGRLERGEKPIIPRH